MHAEREFQATLDLCVDRALKGEEWRSVLTPDDPVELQRLMEVAEMVLAAARKHPPIEPKAKYRLWDRLFNRFSEARVFVGLGRSRDTRGAIPGGECPSLP